MRGENHRALQVFVQVGLPDEGVQAVGVDDRGDFDVLDDPLDELANVVRLAKARADRQDVGLLQKRREQFPGGLIPNEAKVVVFERVGHVRGFKARDRRLNFGRGGDANQSRPGAQGPRPAKAGGSGHAAASGDHENRAVEPLVAVLRPALKDRDRLNPLNGHDVLSLVQRSIATRLASAPDRPAARSSRRRARR